jgi:methionyl-tRNA formyltransferase
VRLAFFCMPSVFSAQALERILDAGHEVVAVVQPQGGLSGRREPTLTRERGLRRRLRKRLLGHLMAEGEASAEQDPFVIAEREDIPRYWAGDASAAPMVQLLTSERVDGVAIVFFNQLLRPSLLERLPAGAVNAHPSLLPHLRGPSPLFWTYQRGDEHSGVTIHRVSAGEDDGPVFGQRRVHVPLGLPGEDLIALLAAEAAPLVVDGLARLVSGPDGTPQTGKESRAPRPTDDDRRLNCLWPARRVFHFVRGVGRWTSLVLEVDGRLYRALDARSYDDERRPPGDWALLGEQTLMLSCGEGSVELHVAALSG